MSFIELLHTFLLLVIIDRLFISRNRYKLSIDTYNHGTTGYWSIWILINDKGDGYHRHKRIVWFSKYFIPHLGK